MPVKNSIYSLLFAAIAIGCGSPAQSDGMEELKVQYDFAFADTSRITKVIISDKKPSQVTLERTEHGWLVDGEHAVRKDAIEVLLETLGSVTLKNFVSKSAVPAVNKRMEVYGKWVEVYSGDELVKSYIVGTETPDMLGTYYRMVDSELPFSVYIQGFNGYLTTRFFTEPSMWRDRTIYGFAPEQIESIEMKVNGVEGFFWMITRKSDEGFNLTASDAASWILVGGEFEPLPYSNPQLLMSAVAAVRTLKYEGAVVATDNIWEKKDSIFNSTPAFSFYVHTTEGEILETRAFYKKTEGILIGEDGTPHEWDPDRFYTKLPDGRMAIIQRYGWRNLMLTPWEFN
ncbi:MAG TPA: hypothetical protein DIT65_02045 [Cryomorphaceae bacterium]|nr:hypothetical protein [Cryomorphaceae bacterium]|tara:strand:+ start:6016 stop:7044 length:1029 start_codon:yes stop_codon:yes gene_type:complete